MEYLAFVLLGFFSSFISAIFGFGTALVVLAVGSHILPVKEAIGLATVLFAASTLTKTLIFRKQINWRLVIITSLGSLPFAYVGASLLTALPAELLKRLLGAMILVYLTLHWSKRFPKFQIGTAVLITGSAAYGFISGLLGSGNLVKVMMFREIGITKQGFVGAMAATSVLSNFAKLSVYIQSEILTINLIEPGIALVLSAIFVALVGKSFLKSVSTQKFEQGIQIVLVISATVLIF